MMAPSLTDTAACESPRAILGPSESFLILESFFVAAQELFVEKGLTECSRTRLYVAPWVHDSPRHFAATRDDGLAMILAPEMVELPPETVDAIVKHEFGHAADFLYPGEFVLGPERVAQRRDRTTFTDAQWHRWLRDWEKRDDDVVEFVADAIAESVDGRRLGYYGPCLLQSFELGKARPQGLR